MFLIVHTFLSSDPTTTDGRTNYSNPNLRILGVSRTLWLQTIKTAWSCWALLESYKDRNTLPLHSGRAATVPTSRVDPRYFSRGVHVRFDSYLSRRMGLA